MQKRPAIDRRILDSVKALVAEVCALEPGEIADDGRLLGYGLDSVRALDLFVAFEDEFGIEVSEHDPELGAIKTVRQLAEFVARRRDAGGPSR